MKKVYIISISVILLVIFLLSIHMIPKNNNIKPNQIYNINTECTEDTDCNFYFLNYSEESPCSSCFFANDGWACMNENGKQLEEESIKETFGELNMMPLCEKCYETDYDSYSCSCINNKCAKQIQ